MSITATNIKMIPFSSEITQKLIKTCHFEWWSEDIEWFIWYNRENDTLYVFWNDSGDLDPEEIRSNVIKELNIKVKGGTARYPLLRYFFFFCCLRRSARRYAHGYASKINCKAKIAQQS